MKCTRVLHALSHPQPVDLAMQLTLSQRQHLYQLLSMSTLRPTQRLPQSTNYPQRTSLLSLPRISSPVSTLAPLPAAPGPRSCLRKCSAIRNKKRVVFADTKGLALTAVRFFIPETTYFTTSPAMGIFSNRHQHHRWRLGFTQQLQDKKNLPERLLDTHVQLGSCKLSEHSLSGRVFASHASTERSVYIRVTFDSWRSHRDIPCTFLQHQQYGGSDVDIFTFDLILPQKIDPLERAEFCVSFRPSFDSAEHWDNNKGQNYRLYFEKDEPMANQAGRHFCYPSLSKRRLPWPTNIVAGAQHSADQLCLHRSLLSGSKTVKAA
ncbi:protein phosphatase 1 regulatory subunit 3C [Gouania willdenowi]|uniref:protein phosphatase 1 regulatory subunit 3C n=1 Tax=Gouania willdenowi TaxID=441366 RepID=UPI001054D177|nr:protein phosphatase 1 regulatory subunit 3C-like [Gouania willdenowi]